MNTAVGAGLAFVAAWFWWSKNQTIEKAAVATAEAKEDARLLAVEHQLVLARLAELETNARLNAQQISPIVTAFQAILVKQLTHPNKDELDALLSKVGPPHILTTDESARLAVMLKERSTDNGPEITASERDAAIILPIVMRMALEEQHNMTAAELEPPTTLKMITVVSVVTDGKPAIGAGGDKKSN